MNAGSMADIAFLLLIFFFMTTTIQSDKGLTFLLPPYSEDPTPAQINERNLFKVLINSKNEILVQGQKLPAGEIKELAKEFILNPTDNQALSESPKKAVISLKAARGSDYRTFIEVLDQLKGAYYEIYAARVHLEVEDFRNLNLKNPREKEIYMVARKDIPMNISLAEN